jgi:hypothetical protein
MPQAVLSSSALRQECEGNLQAPPADPAIARRVDNVASQGEIDAVDRLGGGKIMPPP